MQLNNEFYPTIAVLHIFKQVHLKISICASQLVYMAFWSCLLVTKETNHSMDLKVCSGSDGSHVSVWAFFSFCFNWCRSVWGWKKCIWMTLHMHTMTWSLGMSYWLFNLTNLQRQWSWTLVALHQLIKKLGLAQRPSHCRYSILMCWLLMLVNPRAWSPTSVDLPTLLQITTGNSDSVDTYLLKM